uniref:Mos1 transposase HTH domain-containing protein n=1 Tax=Stegastes partitus TaxID=144197 RepID=A0A3B5B8J3_9TELE
MSVPIGDLDIKLEQRAKIQCCVKLGMSAKETLKILQKAYGKEAMSRSRCFVWHSRFKMGRTSLDDDDRPGRPSTSTTPENVQEIEEIVRQDRRLTIKEIAHMVNMSFGTVQAILTSNLNLHRVAAKFVPRLLTPEQKQQRIFLNSNKHSCHIGSYVIYFTNKDGENVVLFSPKHVSALQLLSHASSHLDSQIISSTETSLRCFAIRLVTCVDCCKFFKV